MRMTQAAIALALLTTLGTAPAHARDWHDDQPRYTQHRPQAYSAAPGLSARQVVAKLERSGYRRIRDLEYDHDDGYWEAEAINRRGQKVEVKIHHSGAILREKLDD